MAPLPSFYYAGILALLMLQQSSIQATSPARRTNTTFIQKSCNSTLYPELCYEYLSPYTSRIRTSPRLLAQTTIAVTLSATRSAYHKLENISRTFRMNSREKAAMRDCLEEVTDSVYELKRSLKEMAHAHPGSSGFELVMSNIQTWTSAALTDEDTCMDGFSGQNMNGKVKNRVRSLMLKVEHLASVALTFINSYASSRVNRVMLGTMKNMARNI